MQNIFSQILQSEPKFFWWSSDLHLTIFAIIWFFYSPWDQKPIEISSNKITRYFLIAYIFSRRIHSTICIPDLIALVNTLQSQELLGIKGFIFWFRPLFYTPCSNPNFCEQRADECPSENIYFACLRIKRKLKISSLLECPLIHKTTEQNESKTLRCC